MMIPYDKMQDPIGARRLAISAAGSSRRHFSVELFLGLDVFLLGEKTIRAAIDFSNERSVR